MKPNPIITTATKYAVWNAFINEEIEPAVDDAFKISTSGDPEAYKYENNQPNIITAVTAPKFRDIDDMAPPDPKESWLV